jgi:hypothetical protein
LFDFFLIIFYLLLLMAVYNKPHLTSPGGRDAGAFGPISFLTLREVLSSGINQKRFLDAWFFDLSGPGDPPF